MNQHLTDPNVVMSAVSEALRHLPGATALYVFGSLADGTGDTLSDVDLTVITGNLKGSIAARHAVLNRVAPLALEWKIDSSRDDLASTYLFADTSPYHKLDLGFVTSDDDVDGSLLWRQEASHTASSGAASVSIPFAPAPGTVEHYVIGQLLGATRYAKARKRGNALLCWRFASALLDAAIALHYSRVCRGPFRGRKLTTSEYLRLDASLSPKEHAHIQDRMQFSTANEMDRAVRLLLSDICEVSAGLAGCASIPAPLVERFMSFFDAELGQT